METEVKVWNIIGYKVLHRENTKSVLPRDAMAMMDSVRAQGISEVHLNGNQYKVQKFVAIGKTKKEALEDFDITHKYTGTVLSARFHHAEPLN